MDWYFPSWNGDIRISGDGELTTLTIIDPTPHERKVLEHLGRFALNEGWVQKASLFDPDGPGTQHCNFEAPMLHVGLTLTHYFKPGIATLTAIKMPDGETHAMGTAEQDFLPWVASLMEDDGPKTEIELIEALSKGVGHQDIQALLGDLDEIDEERVEEKKREGRRRKREKRQAEIAAAKKLEAEEAKKKEAEAAKKKKAVTVKRATPCCPNAIVRDVAPAREVLLAFLDDEQRDQYLSERRFVGVGGITGHRYLFAHRHTATAAQIGKCTYDLDSECPMHFHDWTVPPEEELLAAMLILRHREPWLRNDATFFGEGPTFVNEFGSGGDGIPDSIATQKFGTALARHLGIQLPDQPLMSLGYRP